MLLHLVLADTEFPNDNPWLGDPCGVLAFVNDVEAVVEESALLEEVVVVQVPAVVETRLEGRAALARFGARPVFRTTFRAARAE